MTLAWRHRPLLYADDGERIGPPVDIEQFFAAGRVSLCERTATGTLCKVVRRSSELVNGFTHLRVDARRPRAKVPFGGKGSPRISAPSRAGAPPGSGKLGAIYVHVTHHERHTYLDYWWYFPFNPTPVADFSLCGPGFVIPGLTCFDHVSDWEGMTVVLDESEPDTPPVAVNYSQHEDVVSYEWGHLQRLWRAAKYDQRYLRARAGRDRPLVFVARSSHASYPTACERGCKQVASGVSEAPFDGRQPWSSNADIECAYSCLKPLPVRDRGREPALWNAFEGPWGEQNCILRVYCDVGSAPPAPSNQDRYDEPWCVSKRIPRGFRPPSGGDC